MTNISASSKSEAFAMRDKLITEGKKARVMEKVENVMGSGRNAGMMKYKTYYVETTDAMSLESRADAISRIKREMQRSREAMRRFGEETPQGKTAYNNILRCERELIKMGVTVTMDNKRDEYQKELKELKDIARKYDETTNQGRKARARIKTINEILMSNTNLGASTGRDSKMAAVMDGINKIEKTLSKAGVGCDEDNSPTLSEIVRTEKAIATRGTRISELKGNKNDRAVALVTQLNAEIGTLKRELVALKAKNAKEQQNPKNSYRPPRY